MNCDCIATINEALKAQGLELATSTDLSDFKPRLYLPTRSIESGQPSKEKVAIKFCPECGVKVD